MLWRSVVVLRSEAARRRIVQVLSERSGRIEEASNAAALWESLRREPTDFVFVGEEVLPSPPDSALQSLLHLPDAPSVVVVREADDPETRAHLLALGCTAVIETSLSSEALGDIVRAVQRRRRDLRTQRVAPELEPSRLESFRSANPVMQRMLEVARRVTHTDTSVLVLGETGVGKEHLARALHDQGPRARRPFVAVNCGAIPSELIESELFGHERGAFTGATRAHRGHFELAHGGTIFLDEIAEMPAASQVKLLRVLQDRRIQRVGAEASIPVDARVIAATNRDLDHARREGLFRDRKSTRLNSSHYS